VRAWLSTGSPGNFDGCLVSPYLVVTDMISYVSLPPLRRMIAMPLARGRSRPALTTAHTVRDRTARDRYGPYGDRARCIASHVDRFGARTWAATRHDYCCWPPRRPD